MSGNPDYDGGPWGLSKLGRPAQPVSAENPPASYPDYQSFYPPSNDPLHFDYNSSQGNSLYPKVYAQTQPAYPVRPSQGNYPPLSSLSYPPQYPQGSSPYSHGAPYDQIADPTAPYFRPPSPGYPNAPPHLHAGNAYIPGVYSIPSAPPHLQGLRGPQPGSFRNESDGYSSGGSVHSRTSSERYDTTPGPYAGGPYVQSEFGMPSPQAPPYYSGPLNSYETGPTGASSALVPTNRQTNVGASSRSGRHSVARSLLHGTLDVRIFEAVKLPNMDGFSEKMRQLTSNLPSPFQKAKAKAKEHAPNMVITSDPYATVVLAGARVARTRVISNDANPKWNEHFSIPVAHYVYDVVFTVKDQDVLGTQHIGDVKIPVEQVLSGGVVEGWYDLLTKEGKICYVGARLRLSVRYMPTEQNLIYTQGVGPDAYGVPYTYFPLRKGCKLTLYQDTHIYDNSLPEIFLENSMIYQQRRCWEDLCTAINDARYLVYIAGWSVYDKTKLIRDVHRPVREGGNLTLGELLKKKASQGVRVLLLVWADKTSHDYSYFKTDGVMNTHDEETKKFFKHSGVRCVLAPRDGASKMSWFRQQVVGTLYTHHQKVTIVDAGPRDRRTLTAFIGGLDLCGGRWDTPSHFLFASLSNEHKNDFRNKSWPHLPDSGGPRQPWHDWHCRIEGHAAYDVLTNFEQRWRFATRTHDDELVDMDRHSTLVGPSNKCPPEGDSTLFMSNDSDEETWHVQVFRSIDSGSVKGFPSTVEEVQKQHLVWGKSIAIDVSIQMAYIKAIRSAQHFIYIENQYFLGSSYNWPDYKTAGANHLIPMELALKICSKIREGQRFAVYVVIPMWPEGVPDSGPVQEILYFQTQTMKMMYTLIADALRDDGRTSRKPTDYLNFYCLGNRESRKPGESAPLKPPEPNSKHSHSQKNRRMMIYVHAKGMIVDDEYVLSGSANINQRSMDGSRDTEIAMGGYQPYHTWARKFRPPRGQVYGYRMSLWAEHLGSVEPVFGEPESLVCVERVNNMAEANWKQYTAPEVTDMRGHLMRYPLKIEDDGTVRNLPGYETFPDVGGKIMGANQPSLPDDLTA